MTKAFFCAPRFAERLNFPSPGAANGQIAATYRVKGEISPPPFRPYQQEVPP